VPAISVELFDAVFVLIEVRMASDIFISYRTSDTGLVASFLFKELAQKFGKEVVFLDEDKLRGGATLSSLREHVEAALAVLVLHGGEWLTTQNEHGIRRLDLPEDYVRQEIAWAIGANKVVIPVAVNGAPNLSPEAFRNVPELRPMSELKAMRLRVGDWDADVTAICDRLAEIGVRMRRGQFELTEAEVRRLHDEIELQSRLKTQDAGLRLHQAFANLRRHGLPIPSVFQAYFVGVELGPRNGAGANFIGCTILDSNFSKAILDQAVFDGADLRASIFVEAKLRRAYLRRAILRGCSFEKAPALLADFSGSDLTSARFDEAVLAGTRFSGCNIDDAVFSGANLNAADFTGAVNVRYDQLRQALTLFLASGIPGPVMDQLVRHHPHLLEKPGAADLLFAARGDVDEAGKGWSEFERLLGTMSEDQFQQFLAMTEATDQPGLVQLRQALRGGAG
jgi:uncharacterized protein YjbI with pentapeptide repeats